MSFLIDTNALSELRKRRPHPGVVRWFDHQPPERLHLSVMTLGELREGIAGMVIGDRRDRFSQWLQDELPRYFAGRILAVDAQVADRWGRLCAAAGRPLPVIDSLLAATALTHGLTMVTRNTEDFAISDLQIVDPWQT